MTANLGSRGLSFTIALGLHVLVVVSLLATRHVPHKIVETLVPAALIMERPAAQTPTATEPEKAPAPKIRPVHKMAAPPLPSMPPPVTEASPPPLLPTAPPVPTAQATPALSSSNVMPTYEGLVMAQLERNRRYPREAKMHREEGTVVLRFTLNHDGSLVAFKLDRGSGHASLDDEVLALVQRAAPLPPFPPEMKQATLELIVPIVFALR